MLVAAGADLIKGGPVALGLSFRSGCMTCADVLLKAFPPRLLTATMMGASPPTGPALATPMFLERGATLDARDPAGRSMLMLAAASDAFPVDAVKVLLAKQVDVNERTAAGQTAIGRRSPAWRHADCQAADRSRREGRAAAAGANAIARGFGPRGHRTRTATAAAVGLTFLKSLAACRVTTTRSRR